MSWLGDYAEDATVDFTFTSRQFSTGAPFTLASGALAVYKANSDAQSTAGITLTANFDSVTGLNHVRIDLSADAFYATGADYSVVLTAGTVDSVSVVGETVGTFSIEHRFTGSGASANDIADAILKRDWTAVSGEADYSVLQALRQVRNNWTIIAGVLTVYEEDGTTVAFTKTLTTVSPVRAVTGAVES
jgi:hypothetical protein